MTLASKQGGKESSAILAARLSDLLKTIEQERIPEELVAAAEELQMRLFVCQRKGQRKLRR